VAQLVTGATGVVVAVLLGPLDAAVLLLLGPGAYSVDARLFGRRVVVLQPTPPTAQAALLAALSKLPERGSCRQHFMEYGNQQLGCEYRAAHFRVYETNGSGSC
jgi:hypothetical protein